VGSYTDSAENRILASANGTLQVVEGNNVLQERTEKQLPELTLSA